MSEMLPFEFVSDYSVTGLKVVMKSESETEIEAAYGVNGGSQPSVGDIIGHLNRIAPPELAEEWDNPGLQVGQSDRPVASIRIALDPTPEVVDSACRAGCDLLITHHPLIFRPLKCVDGNTVTGRIIYQALSHEMAIVAAHTNLDAAPGGLNDLLAERMGLKQLRPLTQGRVPDLGIGRVGTLHRPLTLADLVHQLKRDLDLTRVTVAGRSDLVVSQAAVCTGSGSGLWGAFVQSGAQAYISGDLHYHNARDAWDLDLGLVDIGHFASEKMVVDLLSRKLQSALEQEGRSVRIEPDRSQSDPFQTL